MFSCLLTKHFIHWAISSPLPHVFNVIVSLGSPGWTWNLLQSPGWLRTHIPLAFASQVMGLQLYTNTLSCSKLLSLDFHAMPSIYVVLICTCHGVHMVFRAQLCRCRAVSSLLTSPGFQRASLGRQAHTAYVFTY